MSYETQRQLRAVLPLLKGTVVSRDATSFKIAIGGSTTITVRPTIGMENYDLREGDQLTLYTEVLLARKGAIQ